MAVFLHILESIVLVSSLSTDAFAASLAYGANKIRIPAASAAAISLICSGMLTVSMLAGNFLTGFIPKYFTRWLCFFILLALGLTRLFDNCIKSYIRKHNRIRLNFAANDLQFILTVYADAERADADNSKVLSVKEASALAVALSFDGLAVGMGAAVSGVGFLLPAVISLLLTFLAVEAGWGIGRRLPKLIPFDLSYLSAILLILLALSRIV